MILNIQGLNKYYSQMDNRLHILNGLFFQLNENEIVSIVGPSGSGKSTLLSILGAIDQDYEGSVKILDSEIKGLTQNQLTAFRAKNIGIIFQQYHLVSHLTAFENVLIALEINEIADAEKKASYWLDKVGLKKREHHFPNQLSGGEAQRVAIARALALEPQLLLADEPSGNLDIETGQKVMDLLFDLIKQNKTSCVLVTHNLELAARADRRLLLKNGRLE